MPDPDPVPGHEHPHHVEPVVLRRLAMAIDPHESRPRQLPLLPPIHRLDRPAEIIAFTGLYLDEGHYPIPADDEVDVASAIPEPPLHHDPPITPEPPLRDPLSEYSELLPGR